MQPTIRGHRNRRESTAVFVRTSLAVSAAALIALATAATSQADNRRLNQSVIANVYTVQHQAGCTNNVVNNPQLQAAARWHTRDVMGHRDLTDELGSDGSTPQSRADAAGYRGVVQQTVAINPALAISSIELINQWYRNPTALATMQNCSNTQMGVWSENSLDRTVVVAVYGQPA